MHFCVDEYSTGTFRPRDLGSGRMPEKYLIHLQSLRNFEQVAGRNFGELRRKWRKYGL